MSQSPERVKTREFRMRLARMISGVNERPVEVLQHGEPVAVLVSKADFDELRRLRQVYTSVGNKLPST
jgi:prevent-host-death family protein